MSPEKWKKINESFDKFWKEKHSKLKFRRWYKKSSTRVGIVFKTKQLMKRLK